MDKFDFTSHDVEADRQEWLGVWKQTVERHSGGAEIPSFLSFFNEEEIRIVHDLGRRLHLVPGHSLYYEGQVANSFGLVLDGLLEASVQDDNGEPQIIERNIKREKNRSEKNMFDEVMWVRVSLEGRCSSALFVFIHLTP